MKKINLTEQFSWIQQSLRSTVVGELNDSAIKLEQLSGEYPWQQHDHKDEMILVVNGRLLLMSHERNIWIEAGELLVIPKGTAYKWFVPNGVCHLLVIEPKQLAALKRCS
ncbi:mannose-6-phosphate isomerase [Brevibacillus parabrevis]|uniref:cupin domain-containing protein n=1 Tax=Brevibacillus parabrevis TaxID=54914 RepID=UPI0007ABC6C8|nr:cupin domain-containing protein [Brevibacillus parabrevis]KZE54118.1 mannose-6-phosphate isomerase [Brevibacillus parabrevis]